MVHIQYDDGRLTIRAIVTDGGDGIWRVIFQHITLLPNAQNLQTAFLRLVMGTCMSFLCPFSRLKFLLYEMDIFQHIQQ